MPKSTRDILLAIQTIVTDAGSVYTGAQRQFLTSLMDFPKVLAQFLGNPNEKNEQKFLMQMRAIAVAPKTDPAMANNPDVGNTVKRVLQLASDALSAQHNEIASQFDERKSNRLSDAKDKVEEQRHRPRMP